MIDTNMARCRVGSAKIQSPPLEVLELTAGCCPAFAVRGNCSWQATCRRLRCTNVFLVKERSNVYEPMTVARLGTLLTGADDSVRWRLVAEFLEEYSWEPAELRMALLEDEPARTDDEHQSAADIWCDLNVCAPRAAMRAGQSLPVLAWIHGASLWVGKGDDRDPASARWMARPLP